MDTSNRKTETEMEFNSRIDKRINTVVPKYLRTAAFTDDKYTDTPTDSNSVVNRKYVTLNGSSANRPTSSVVGQYYFDTDLGRPIWWDGISFVDADGNVI